jgi:class 3 adenylate cyclase
MLPCFIWEADYNSYGDISVTTERVERRLAAVLAADVAGYSRLMGADEEGTLAPSERSLLTPLYPLIEAALLRQPVMACWRSSPAL